MYVIYFKYFMLYFLFLQFAQPLIAQTLWKSIMQVAPEAIGPVNPSNNKISALFGDQGGH